MPFSRAHSLAHASALAGQYFSHRRAKLTSGLR